MDASWTAAPEPLEVVVDTLAAQLRDFINAELRAAQTPQTLVSLANSVMSGFPGTVGPEGAWLGTGSFKALLGALDIADLQFLVVPPGFAYLVGLHDPSLAESRAGAQAGGRRAGIPDAGLTIHDETGVPLLTGTQFGAMFAQLSDAINRGGYDPTRLSRDVRDRLQADGESMARASISFVIKGIGLAGHSWSSDAPQDAGTLARAFLDNVNNLVASSDLELTPDEQVAVEEWIMGATLLSEQEPTSDASAVDNAELSDAQTDSAADLPDSDADDAIDGGPPVARDMPDGVAPAASAAVDDGEAP